MLFGYKVNIYVDVFLGNKDLICLNYEFWGWGKILKGGFVFI